jgi:hypothetical protein
MVDLDGADDEDVADVRDLVPGHGQETESAVARRLLPTGTPTRGAGPVHQGHAADYKRVLEAEHRCEPRRP